MPNLSLQALHYKSYFLNLFYILDLSLFLCSFLIFIASNINLIYQPLYQFLLAFIRA